MIRFPCPCSGRIVKATEESAGKTGKCKCGELLRIPSPILLDKASRPEAQPSLELATPQILQRVELILCLVCRKQVAEDAPACPSCGAIQTPASKAKGRQLKRQANIFATIVCVLMALPLLTCCLGGLFRGPGPSPQPENQRGPGGWDKAQLDRDVKDVVNDPNKTILIPYDGGQPRVVTKP